MRTIKLKVHTIIITHKYGEDVYLTKDKPTQIQLEEIRKWYIKAYDLKSPEETYIEYYHEENVTDLLSSNELIHKFKNMCWHYYRIIY